MNMSFLSQGIKDLFVPPKKQIAALDGVRTLAILLVVGLHSNVHIIHSGLELASFTNVPPFRGGWIGVPLFFILSGFFIGSQLWREFHKTSTIKIGKFILRRGLRIWPLYYFVFFSVYALFPERCKKIWTSFFFVANYFGDEGPVRGAWSLSTEEQFYIVIPTFIFCLARFFKFKHLSQYRRTLYFVLLLPILSRTITWYYLTGFEFFDITLYRFNIYRPFHTHFDGLIVGLILSNIICDKDFKRPSWLQHYWKLLIGSFVIGGGLSLINKVSFGYAGLALFFGAFVWMALNKKNILTKILSWGPFYWTAKVSYGVYLFHHPVLWWMDSLGWFEQVLWHPDIFLLLTYGITFAVSCFIASITYILIEAPAIQWRQRLLKRI